MKLIRTLAATVAASLSLTGAAAADQPEIFGPIEYDAAFTFTNCGFRVDVSLHGTFENRMFVNPANGATALVRHMYTEIGRPPTSPEEGWGTFATRGLTTRVLVPGSGVVLLDAGYLLWRYPDGFAFVAHGNHQLEIEGDIAELCAALAA